MPSAALTTKGQLTIPKAIREMLRLKPGHGIEFVVRADGGVYVVPALASRRSAARPASKPKQRPVGKAMAARSKAHAKKRKR